MKLNQLADKAGAVKARTRIARGIGSGKGKTGGRGIKGQKSRSGVSINGFEGGQMPIYRRLPKRGFNNIFANEYQVINLDTLQAAVEAEKIAADAVVTAESLKEAGVIRRTKDGVRLLGRGEIKVALKVQVAGATKSAIEAIEKAGGSVEILEAKKAADA
jgi:large subunit ribosomal protein L15